MAIPIHRFLKAAEGLYRPIEGLGEQASWLGTKARTFMFDIDNTITKGENIELWPLPEEIRRKAGGEIIPGIDLQRRFIADDENVFQIGQNWDQWNAARAHAEPNPMTLGVLQDIRAAGHNLIGVTARTRESDAITRGWFNKHGLDDIPFISRAVARGEESSSTSKTWAIEQMRRQGVNLVGGMEDSASNAAAFNKLGIPHALVENGKFVDIPRGMPIDITATMHAAPRRISTARYQHMTQQSAGGFIDDPTRLNPHMRTRPSSGRR